MENSSSNSRGRPQTATDLFGPTPQVRADIVRLTAALHGRQ
jgi:hypothetical protein